MKRLVIVGFGVAACSATGSGSVGAQHHEVSPDGSVSTLDVASSAGDVPVTPDTEADTSEWVEPPLPVPPVPPAPWLDDCPAVWLDSAGGCYPSTTLCAPAELAVPSLGCVSLEAGASPLDGAAVDLAGALAALPPEGPARIELAPGEHVGGVSLTRAVELVGSGALSTALRSASAEVPVLVVAAGVEVSLSDVTIDGSGVGIQVEAGGRLRLERVRIRTGGYGVVSLGGSVTLTRVLFDGAGSGVTGSDGASVELLESTVAVRGERGVKVDASSALVVDDVLFESFDRVSHRRPVRVRGSAKLRRVAFVGPSGVAVEPGEGSTGVVLDGVLVHGSESVLHWDAPDTVTARRVHFEDTHLSTPKCFPLLDDFVFRRVSTVGEWFPAGRGRETTWRRGLIEDGVGFPLVAETRALIEDVTIRRVDNEALHVRSLGELTLRRVAIEGVTRFGIRVVSPAARLDAQDLVVTATEPLDGNYGAAIFATGGPTISLRRSELRGAQTAGVFAFGATVVLEDTRISGIAPGTVHDHEQGPISGIGDGILALEDTTLSLTRCSITDVHRAAILSAEGLGVVSQSRLAGRMGIVSLTELGTLVGAGNVFECETPTMSESEQVVPKQLVF